MKEADIDAKLAAANVQLQELNAQRDAIVEKIRAISAYRADLEGKKKLLEMPPSKARTQALEAVGVEPTRLVKEIKAKSIPSAEKFGKA